MSLHQGSDKNWCLVCPLTYPHKTHNLAGHEPIRLVVGTAQSVHLQSFCEVWVMGENAANVKKKKNCIFLSWCMVYIKQEGNENPMQSMKFPYITFKCNGFMQNHRTHFLRWGGRGGSHHLVWYIWPLFRELMKRKCGVILTHFARTAREHLTANISKQELCRVSRNIFQRW